MSRHSSPRDRGGDRQITSLLLQWSAGDPSALASLFPLVYEDLRAAAAGQMRLENRSHTLQRTALVHEAFLRLVDQRQVSWQSRSQFFSLAAQIMRRILVDHARRRLAGKRGGDIPHVSLEEAALDDTLQGSSALQITDGHRVHLGAIDEALKRLEALDPRQGKLVELRFFASMSVEQTADVLGISEATVKREWASARAWLQREIGEEPRA